MNGAPLVCLSFLAGGERFALPVESVREAARRPRIAKLPGSPPGCAGVAILRGAPTGILELGTGDSAGAPFVVVLEGKPYALLVDRIEGVVMVDGAAAGPRLLDVESLLPAERRTGGPA